MGSLSISRDMLGSVWIGKRRSNLDLLSQYSTRLITKTARKPKRSHLQNSGVPANTKGLFVSRLDLDWHPHESASFRRGPPDTFDHQYCMRNTRTVICSGSRRNAPLMPFCQTLCETQSVEFDGRRAAPVTCPTRLFVRERLKANPRCPPPPLSRHPSPNCAVARRMIQWPSWQTSITE